MLEATLPTTTTTTAAMSVINRYSDRKQVTEMMALLKTKVGRKHVTKSTLKVFQEEIIDLEQEEQIDVESYGKLVMEVEALKLENEKLRCIKHDDENKITALSRMAGPLLENVVYQKGRSPPKVTNSMSLKSGIKHMQTNREVCHFFFTNQPIQLTNQKTGPTSDTT